jgi:predicted N-formylglutamate amidohydrolase
VIHLSIHSFTPLLNGHLRNCDIGLLYDSSKQAEKEFCKTFKTLMLQQRSDLNIRYNYPYLGKADGFTTYLRKRYPHRYLGIEIEINQHFVTDDIMDYDIKSTMHHTIIQLKSVIKN